MKVSIDIPVFAPTASVGHVTGELELPAIPRKGEMVSLAFSNKQIALRPVRGFNGSLRVEDVIYSVSPGTVMLLFQDVQLESVEDARAVMQYLERGFNLYAAHHLTSE